MSMENVAKFYNEVMKDEVLKGKLGGVSEKTLTKEVFESKVLPEAKAKGYDFSYEDVKEYYKKQSEKSELNVDELGNVSGGSGCDDGTVHVVRGPEDNYAAHCNKYICAIKDYSDKPTKERVCGECHYFKVGGECYMEGK